MTTVDVAARIVTFTKTSAPDASRSLSRLGPDHMRLVYPHSVTAGSPAKRTVGDFSAPSSGAMHSVSRSNQPQHSEPNREPPRQQRSTISGTRQHENEGDLESLTINTDFGEFVSADPDTRPRSNSLHIRTGNTYRHPGVTAIQQAQRNDARFFRAGSADNIVNQGCAPTTRLTHSNTITEIPIHYRDALSNDSGYATPPFARPHTSPPWPSGHPAQQPSPPPGSLMPGQPSPLRVDQHPIPHHQRLTIDIGHFQPEPDAPELVVGEPLPYSYQPLTSSVSCYNFRPMASEPRYSMPPIRSTSSASEEGVIGYQKERCERLVQAFNHDEAEVAAMEDKLKRLRRQIEETRSQGRVDLETAKEVDNLERENNSIRQQIQNLERTGPPPRPPCPPPRSAPVVHRPAPPPPAEEAQWSCPACTYINHGLVTCCEMCETRNPAHVSGNGSASGHAPAGQNGLRLVKTSACTHQSGCFCHAHLS